MFAVVEEIGFRIQTGVSGKTRDPAREIDTSAFLAALQGRSLSAERAFRDLDFHFRGPLVRFLGQWFRETGTIEELLQEILLAVYEGLPAFPGGSDLTTWVYSLACEKARSRLSEEYGNCPEDEDFRAQAAEVEAAEPMPDEAAHQALLVDLVLSAAETLPEHYREVWRLRDFESMSGEEVAEAIGITPALVRVRLHRARGLITDRLRKERPGLFRKIRKAGPSRQFPGSRG